MVGGNLGARERIDRSCDLLAHAYRRRLLYDLRTDGAATVEELADSLVAAGLADAADRALASLVHTHLPKMADYGAVEYDREAGVVEMADDVEYLDSLLDLLERRESDAGVWSAPESSTQA